MGRIVPACPPTEPPACRPRAESSKQHQDSSAVSTEISPVRARLRRLARGVAALTRAHRPMRFPTYAPAVASRIERYHDDVRYATLALAIQRLEDDGIGGAFAELGVYRGVTSAFIHLQAPKRHLYLFDTFEGFPQGCLEGAADERFRDTSQEAVAKLIRHAQNVEFRKGRFPDTVVGLETERFALVMLDFDKYAAAMSALEFFYPRLVRGAYFFMHDFNSPESERGISRAALKFLAARPELLVEIPDFYGSAVFRKVGKDVV